MTMRISKFWKALDALSDAATDRREWASLLGDEFRCVVVDEPDCLLPLVRSTGTPATSIACPSPGGEGCPRRIVHHDDGAIRAVCGDSPKVCADLDLNKNDIMIYGLDRVGLARSIAAALDLSNRPVSFDRRPVFRIGSHDVFAGRGFPVFLTVPGPLAPEDAAQFDEVIAHPGPRLLLAPTLSSIPAQLATALDREGVVHMGLEDLVDLDDAGRFQLCQPSTVVFADLRAQVASGMDNAVSNLAWALPTDARWEEIGIRFVADEVVNVSFRGETRRFEPDGLGLKSAKNGKPKAAWAYLKAFAMQGGRLPVHHAKSTETSKHQKQKQALSKVLRAAFGIAEEPLPTVGDEYVARFVANADDLQQGQLGQSRRKFAD
jgi:hypothetical protein